MMIRLYTESMAHVGAAGAIPQWNRTITGLGTAHVEALPRTGDALMYHGQTYRVMDVAHPTVDTSVSRMDRSVWRPAPLVLVEVSDTPWLDGMA